MNRLIDSNDPLVIKVAPHTTASGRHRPATAIDFRRFREGSPKTWNGRPFSGRPQLAEELVAPLRDAVLSEATLVHKGVQLRALFEFADHRERSTGHRIDSVRDIPAVWKAFQDFLSVRTFGWNYETLRTCKGLIEASPDFEGLKLPKKNPFSTRPTRRGNETDELYSKEAQARMTDTFRSVRLELQGRVAESQLAADRGCRPGDLIREIYLSGMGHGFAAVHREDILRFFRDDVLTHDRLLNFLDFRAHYGFLPSDLVLRNDAPVVSSTYAKEGKSKDRARGRNGIAGLYRFFCPVAFDLAAVAAEFILRTGCNQQVLFDMDRRTCLGAYGPRAKITSLKTRAGGTRIGIKSTQEPDTPYDILASALELTEPLHDIVVRQLSMLRSLPDPDMGQLREIDRLARLENRVWLVVDLHIVQVTELVDNFREHLNEILRRSRVEENGHQVTWSSQRVRTTILDDSFEENDHDIEAVSAEAGHASIEMTDDYLENGRRRKLEGTWIFERMNEFATSDGRKAAFAAHFNPGSKPTLSEPAMLVVTPAGKSWIAKNWSKLRSPAPVSTLKTKA